MKVAVTYENGEIFQHFGRTPAFKVYEVDNGSVLKSSVVETNGTGHGALAGFLKEMGAEVLICGGIGGGAIMAMAEAGVKVYAGAAGKADDVIADYACGILPEVGEATCDHHGHGEHGDHDCGDHGCGHGGCHEE